MLSITAGIFFTSCKDDEDTPEQPQEEKPGSAAQMPRETNATGLW